MKRIGALFFMVVSFPLMASETLNVIKPTVLVALKEGSEQYQGVCNALKKKCEREAKIWKVRGGEDIFYFTNPSLELIKIRKVSGAYIQDGLWEFGNYKHSYEGADPDEELNDNGVYIYPALYPLSKTKQAVALVSNWGVGYSGGGLEYEYADFMMLNNDGSYEAAFKNIPFSSMQMIRACFSEEDYAKNLHCHNGWWNILNLKFIDDGKEYYSYKFIQKSYGWPSFTDKSAIKVEISESIEYPFQQ
ncbi:hypothetical protein [Xenorhabdus sp. KK7.4]|uniref:hypothetical protein n=1 Tax=Xenorhabdus sp. KK7.4 TaxID=1851572 RepID=UPI000C04C604|nr:hypothetical protein [Xenorhabdus sp. KK7.4]PHM56907.1 hypothetical protein Xekk_01473 [Xenorhabdus sp. KK7.4]